MPTFSAPPDCTPWVIGDLWPEELSHGSPETATLAQYLKVDLQRIAGSANDDLRAISRAGLDYAVRRDTEARVIDQARDRAVRRVESTMRQLRQMGQRPRPDTGHPVPKGDEPADRKTAQLQSAALGATQAVDIDKTQVIPAVKDGQPQYPAPVLDDRHQEPQPGGAERETVAEDAAKHRLRADS